MKLKHNFKALNNWVYQEHVLVNNWQSIRMKDNIINVSGERSKDIQKESINTLIHIQKIILYHIHTTLYSLIVTLLHSQTNQYTVH